MVQMVAVVVRMVVERLRIIGDGRKALLHNLKSDCSIL